MYLIDKYLDKFLDQRIFFAACEGGAPIDTLEYLLAWVAPDWKEAVNAAARGGHLHVLQWMMADREDRRSPWGSDLDWAPSLAAEYGHLEFLQWLHINDVGDFSWSTMDRAAFNGHLEVVQWLNTNRPESRSNKSIYEAAERGHLRVVQWLHVHRLSSSINDAKFIAAGNGHLHIVKWLHQKQYRENLSRALNTAAAGGHLGVVQWLFDHGFKSTTITSERAAGSGSLEVVQWFHKYFDNEFTTEAMNVAAAEGHFNVVKWLHEHRTEGCTTEAMDRAACFGHLDIMQWLHENRHEGCTTKAMDEAAFNGHLDAVQWLHKHRSEGCTDDGMARAAWNGRVEVVCFLYDNKINRAYGAELRLAADRGYLNMIQAMSEKKSMDFAWGLPPPDKRIEQCVANMLDDRRSIFHRVSVQTDELLESLEWFHAHGCKEWVSDLLNVLLKRGNFKLVRRFFEHKADLDYMNYIAKASTRKIRRTSMRWLIENGPELDIFAAKKVFKKMFCMRNVEVTWWLCESDRASIVCDALHEKWSGWEELLLWILNRTKFEESTSRALIYGAMQRAPDGILRWFASFVREDVQSWCFPG